MPNYIIHRICSVEYCFYQQQQYHVDFAIRTCKKHEWISSTCTHYKELAEKIQKEYNMAPISHINTQIDRLQLLYKMMFIIQSICYIRRHGAWKARTQVLLNNLVARRTQLQKQQETPLMELSSSDDDSDD